MSALIAETSKTKLDVARHMKDSSAADIHAATLDFPLPANYYRDLVIAGFKEDIALEIVALARGVLDDNIDDVQHMVAEMQQKEAEKVEFSVQRVTRMKNASAFAAKDVEEEYEEEIEVEAATFMMSDSSYNNNYDDYDDQGSGRVRSNCTMA